MNSSKNNLSWIQDAILNNLLNDKEKRYTYWIKEEELPKKKKCSEDKWENLSVRPRKEKKKKKNDSRWKEQLGARFTRVITS